MATTRHAESKRHAWTPASEKERARRVIARAPARVRDFLRQFASWLETERGRCAESITYNTYAASLFLADLVPEGTPCSRAVRSVTPTRVEDLFIKYANTRGLASRRTIQHAMRLALQFAARRGWVSIHLADAVPSVRTYRLGSIPRGASNDQVRTLLRLVNDDGERARNQAIVYLLAVYGVRRGQVCALRLQDIDWKERTIVFAAHKGGKPVRHTLTAVVADAIARYIRDERPQSPSDQIFLRCRVPYLPLSPQGVSDCVRSRMLRNGLPPFGSHALRHAFATRLLRSGQSVKAIADLLGHRSLSAVGVYAKVDLPRLFEVAVEWPEVAS